jgi:Tol biopolymer transport system component
MTVPRRGSAGRLVALGLALLCVAGRFLPQGTTLRVSVGPGGAEAVGDMSSASALSASGRIVAFSSRANNLVPGHPSTDSDIYVRDFLQEGLTWVSMGLGGVAGDGDAFDPALSASGRYVVFDSSSSNLVAGDGNGQTDIFVHDRKTGTTTRVSVSSDGVESNGYATEPAISASGRVVAWASEATNLVPGDGNGQADVFVRDRTTRRTTRVSVRSDGAESDRYSEEAALSGNGRYVAFGSYATNLVDDDANGEEDVFVHDRTTGRTTRVSVATGGTQALGGGSAYPSVSASGRWVAFQSDGTNLVPDDTNGESDVFVHDRKTGTTTRVSLGTGGIQVTGGGSGTPRLSADGRYVLFDSHATNLVANDTNAERDVFLHDRRKRATIRVSVSSGGLQANDRSFLPALSRNGQVVSFASDATNLAPADTNGYRDVFLRRW